LPIALTRHKPQIVEEGLMDIYAGRFRMAAGRGW